DAERGVGVAAAGVRLQVDELSGGGERGEPRDVDLYGAGQGAAADLQQHLVEEVVVRVGGGGDLHAGAGRVIVHHRLQGVLRRRLVQRPRGEVEFLHSVVGRPARRFVGSPAGRGAGGQGTGAQGRAGGDAAQAQQIAAGQAGVCRARRH